MLNDGSSKELIPDNGEPKSGLSKYPFDFLAYKKGDYISKAELEQLMPELLHYDDDQYSFFLMKAQGDCVAAHWQATEQKIYVKIENKGLRLLTDAETSEYLARRNRYLRNGMFRNVETLQHVDKRELDSDEFRRHEQTLVAETFYKQALAQAERAAAKLLQARLLDNPKASENEE